MFNAIREIIKYRDLLMMLTFRDIRIRYKQAAMGFMWAIFMPIVGISAGIVIKKAISIVSGTDIEMLGIVSIAVKFLPYSFFIKALQFSVSSLVGNSQLITKIYFPKAVLPLAAIFACLFDLIVAAAGLILILALVKLGISAYVLWMPILILFLFLYSAGLGLVLASANLFYRDVKYVIETILMFGIFYTPVFYDASDFGKYSVYLLLNPVGSILECINSVVVLKQAPEYGWLLYAGVMSFAMFFVGMKVFQKNQSLFAENI